MTGNRATVPWPRSSRWAEPSATDEPDEPDEPDEADEADEDDGAK
jgi:hypothetical protein